MATGSQRDLGRFAAGFGRWLAAHRPGPPPSVVGVAHASDGLSNETVLVDLAGDGRPPERLVVRMAPLQPLFPSHGLSVQGQVQAAVAAAGVRAPAPCQMEPDEAWVGTPFLVMPYLAGHIPGIVPSFDPFVQAARADQQRRLHDGMVDTLAAVHAVDWEAAGLGAVLRAAVPLAAEVEWWVAYGQWAADGRPSHDLAAALAWCRANVPPTPHRPVLLWGDARLGNLVVDDHRDVVGVLDWEMASLGPPEMDLGWYLALDDATATLVGRPVAGFPPHAETVARYEAATSRPVEHLAFHRTFALIRAMAVSERQGALAAGAEGGAAGTRRRDPLAPLIAARIAGHLP